MASLRRLPFSASVRFRRSFNKVTPQLESRMRETRLSGSEGGGAEFNRLSLPLFPQSGPSNPHFFM